jgi:hypothetical protein
MVAHGDSLAKTVFVVGLTTSVAANGDSSTQTLFVVGLSTLMVANGDSLAIPYVWWD